MDKTFNEIFTGTPTFDSRKSSTKGFLIYNNELIPPSKDENSAKTFVHNTLLRIFTVLHYFGELIAIGMRPDMVDETVDSILVCLSVYLAWFI